ncbi:MAG: YceI family protein [Lewinellaceae bacterium]|nr:YceI family protein [Lewinellaceae bacterium]
MRSFTGFNSALQQEHFYENYIETERYPITSFNGKIIEKIDFNANGSYTIRAKGKLFVHGESQERIIKSTLDIRDQKAVVHSEFTILLSDHNIDIPKIVSQKIATEIRVEVDATLYRKPPSK